MLLGAIILALAFAAPAYRLALRGSLDLSILIAIGGLPGIAFMIGYPLLVGDLENATFIGQPPDLGAAGTILAAVFGFACWCGGAWLGAGRQD